MSNFKKDTQTVQNILARLEKEVFLNVDSPTGKQKTLFHKAEVALSQATHAFDMLNDQIEES